MCSRPSLSFTLFFALVFFTAAFGAPAFFVFFVSFEKSAISNVLADCFALVETRRKNLECLGRILDNEESFIEEIHRIQVANFLRDNTADVAEALLCSRVLC